MVSTRGVRYKFSEGERVLCYEPDPTKAKVLYDSKVLEVVESKDKRGRRTVEYLIHFQGWNSSWDRCVSEDFVLKDTEENRQLQRDLAEKSQLQLGAYLYRRERKKGSSTSGSGAAKRPRHGFSDDGSSSSTQPDDAEGEGGDTDSSGSGTGSQSQSPPPPQPGRAHIPLPSQLRDRLTFDYHLVVKRGKVSKLPASPCAAEILESFVKWYARAGAWYPPRSRHDPPLKPDMIDASSKLNLVREVADSLRVYFDFILRGHLLYKQEHNQYHDLCGQYIEKQDEWMEKSSQDAAFDSLLADSNPPETSAACDIKSPNVEYAHLPPFSSDEEKNGEKLAKKIELQMSSLFEPPKDIETKEVQDTKDLKEAKDVKEVKDAKDTKDNKDSKETKDAKESKSIKEAKESKENKGAKDLKDVKDSKGIKDTKDGKDSRGVKDTKDVKVKDSKTAKDAKGSKEVNDTKNNKDVKKPCSDVPIETEVTAPLIAAVSNLLTTGKQKEVKPVPRPANVARRLRSHKSIVSQGEPEDPGPSTSAVEPKAFETMSSSFGSSGGSSLSESFSRPTQAATPTVPAQPTRSPLSLLLEKVSNWEIVPRHGTEHLPCRVYGAIHLSRLFVKLPEFLNASAMNDYKLKLILKHIDMFVQYIDEHSDWFGETFYISDSVGRSH